MTTPAPTLRNALPFWMSLLMVPMGIVAAIFGGWTIALIPAYGWIVMSILDRFAGLETDNMDLETGEADLYWYKLITIIWLPIQLTLVFGCLMVINWGSHLSGWESVFLMMAMGVVSGSIGINYAHELIHQKNRLEQRLGEALLISVLYGHFRSEHLIVHHRYVGTPRDPVTARYNESFYRFFIRVLPGCFRSAWNAEVDRLHRKGLPALHRSNPFWRYGLGAISFLAIAALIGGWAGVGLFVIQAFVAILQLELVNYVEHYGLTRRHLGDGKYEHVQPRHSWNAAHKMTNFLLINLQRHSDHHYKPDRRFPLLQTYEASEAPQLPFGYPLMTAIATNPLLWRRMMNPMVRKWRQDFYPDITDWKPYSTASNPMPR